MRTLLFLVLAMLALGCNDKSAREQAREQTLREQERRGQKPAAPPPAAEPTTKTEPVAPTVPAAAELPEPTTPDEIDKARKQAMIDGRTADVVKYCELAKVETGNDGQALLGCVLAACREKAGDKASAWGKRLAAAKDGKALLKTAVTTCTELGVGL